MVYIYANIGGIWMANVTIYSIHGSYGIYIYIYVDCARRETEFNANRPALSWPVYAKNPAQPMCKKYHLETSSAIKNVTKK